MTAMDFPATPSVGQIYPNPPVTGMPVYTWDGVKWTIPTDGLLTPKVTLLADGSVPMNANAQLTLGGDPIHPTDAADKHYVDAALSAAIASVSTVTRSYLAGLTLSNSGTTSIGIAPGVAADAGNATMMSLAAAFTKTNAAWAAGSGVGGLDTGAMAGAATWYHFHLIKNPTSSAVDVLFSLSPSVPTLPAGFTLFRRIGACQWTGSAWTKFSQLGDEFLLDAPVLNINAFTGSTAIQTATLNVPTGLQVGAILTGQISINGTPWDARGWIFSPDINSGGTLANTAQTLSVGLGLGTGTSITGAFQVVARTNPSAQIKYALTAAAASMYMATAGWIDRRGRDA